MANNRFKFHDGILQKKLDDCIRCNKSWMVTGVAGFVGSNLLEYLLLNNQTVLGIDNFLTGSEENLKHVKSLVSKEQWERFEFVNADISNANTFDGISDSRVSYILHQAALGSVPRSIKNPLLYTQNNVIGTQNIFDYAKKLNHAVVIYASSSSVYGDSQSLPKCEENIGKPLSPYAATKLINEIYGKLYYEHYGLKSVGLRYFNVFGPRQNKDGAYAAVIPKWIDKIIRNDDVEIYGDGKNFRDFCYIDNVVQANVKCALIAADENIENLYLNVAVGARTSLCELLDILIEIGRSLGLNYTAESKYSPERKGDVKESHANILKLTQYIKYQNIIGVHEGLIQTMEWYLKCKYQNLKLE